jgi:hypothetical protein
MSSELRSHRVRNGASLCRQFKAVARRAGVQISSSAEREQRKDVVWVSWESGVPETTLARCARSVRMRSGREFLGAENSKLYGGGIGATGKKIDWYIRESRGLGEVDLKK